MVAAYQAWLTAAQADAEYQFSMDGYAEHAANNDYEFTEDGKQK